MATEAAAASITPTTTNTDNDHPTKPQHKVVPPTTTTEGDIKISGETSPATSTKKKEGGSDESKTKSGDPVTAKTGGKDEKESVDAIQRKIRRAERFGMPVKLSEEEKRNSRAERFGTTPGKAPGSQASDTTKKAEELKRKARAERFGITQSTPGEEDEKKKARLSKFGAAASADPLEEEKKNARALRFSGTNGNGNGKIEQKVTVAGDAEA